MKSTLAEEPKQKSKNMSNVCPFRRFDPENPEHIAWLESTKKKEGKEKQLKKESGDENGIEEEHKDKV
jgi:hypothetical protein